MGDFGAALPLLREAAAAFRAPRRVRVSDGAAQSLVIRQPGGYSGPWSAAETPYMVEPMDMLASRAHEAVCFVGPSRAGKTMALLDAFLTYAVTCDPGDMLIVQMSQDKAREYSKTRVDRLIRHSPDVRALMSKRGHDDNTHDKAFVHGMFCKIGWPSASQLSGSDYRYTALTDYDRMPDNIDGEADAFGLALTRTRTFLSRGMCMVESSPGREITDPHWRPATAHEGPPSTGVCGIYNRSDRRRWYWPCPHCGEYHQAASGLSLFATLPAESDLVETIRGADLDALAARHAIVVCPNCAAMIGPEHKQAMNAAGQWLCDGQTIDGMGRVHGNGIRSSIAGYWLGGVSAAYQSWHRLLLAYLQALREYAMTGSELPLQKTTNTDQAMPYLSRALAAAAEGTASAVAESLPRYMVPAEARFLIAAVDVQGGQKSRFVVQVHAVGAGLEQWVVDRYNITASPRGDGVALDPAGYAEDWESLTNRVINSTYRIDDGRELRVLLTVVDTGGEGGATSNAYAWYRRLRQVGMSGRVMLVKGGSSKPESPVTKATPRDARNKPLHDVPLYLLDTDYFKDIIAASRRRKAAGPGFYHFPDWLPETFHDELNAEVRQPNGKWKQVRARNESLDLCGYILAACWKLKADKMNWSSPPAWAKPLSENSNVITPEDRRQMHADQVALVQSPPPSGVGGITLANWKRGK